jgi:hypothetical protein
MWGRRGLRHQTKTVGEYEMTDRIMPIQPIDNDRFVPNRIVQKLLDASPIGMNELAGMYFTRQERMQFAQLIGYSLSGFGELGYVDDETYYACQKIAIDGITECEARNAILRKQLQEAKQGVKDAAAVLFGIHPDDLDDLGNI